MVDKEKNTEQTDRYCFTYNVGFNYSETSSNITCPNCGGINHASVLMRKDSKTPKIQDAWKIKVLNRSLAYIASSDIKILNPRRHHTVFQELTALKEDLERKNAKPPKQLCYIAGKIGQLTDEEVARNFKAAKNEYTN